MVRQPVKHLQPLHIIICGDAHADIRTHLLFRHRAQGGDIDQAAKSILASLAPAVAFHDGEHLGAQIEDIRLWQESFEKEVPILRMVALALVVGGVVAYRWDVNISGQLVQLSYLPEEMVTRYTSYFPSLIEILSGAGIVAYGALALTLGIRYLNVVNHAFIHEPEPEAETQPAPAD